jgi:hypothetical protein
MLSIQVGMKLLTQNRRISCAAVVDERPFPWQNARKLLLGTRMKKEGSKRRDRTPLGEKRTLGESIQRRLKGVKHSVRMIFAPKWMKEYERMQASERDSKRR